MAFSKVRSESSCSFCLLGIADSYDDPVSNHFVMECPIATVLCEGVESRDKGINWLARSKITFCLFVK